MSSLLCSLQVWCSLWSPSNATEKGIQSHTIIWGCSHGIKEISFKWIPDGEWTSAVPSLGPGSFYSEWSAACWAQLQSAAAVQNWLCSALSPESGRHGVTSLCRTLKMNSREDNVLKLPFFKAYFLPILKGQLTDPPEGVASPVPTLWMGACSVSQSCAREVLKLPVHFQKNSLKSSVRVMKLLCWVHKKPPAPAKPLDPAVLSPAGAPGCVFSR